MVPINRNGSGGFGMIPVRTGLIPDETGMVPDEVGLIPD